MTGIDCLDTSSQHTCPDCIVRCVRNHDRVGTDGHVVANFDRAENLRSRAYLAVVADNGNLVMPTAPADGHLLPNYAIAAHLRPLVYDAADPLVGEDSTPPNSQLAGIKLLCTR